MTGASEEIINPTVSSTATDNADEADEAERRAHHEARLGVLFGIAAYGFWGLATIYFKALTDGYLGLVSVRIAAPEILAHRVVWSVLMLFGLLTIRGQWSELREALRSKRTVLTLIATTILIGLNWFTYIWCVENERVLDASLGYYMNPLVNVLLGFAFLRERMRPAQLAALGIAASGVGVMTYASLGGATFPWPALVLAFSFGTYGLLRKIAPVNGVPGLTFETALLAPAALWYILHLGAGGAGHFTTATRATDLLLIASGIVTIFPLICFANAARRLRLSTLGFIQYIAPTAIFLIGVGLFGEPVTWPKIIAFACIWTALALYSWDTWTTQRRRRFGRRPARVQTAPMEPGEA